MKRFLSGLLAVSFLLSGCARTTQGDPQDATFIFVTNEIGMGGTSENELQRKFTDMQGWMNQYVAARADEVILMVSGIPLTVKNTHS